MKNKNKTIIKKYFSVARMISLILAMSVIGLSMIALVSCDVTETPSDTTSPDGSSSSDTTAGALEKSKFTFVVEREDNFEISVDMDMAEVLTALGEPVKYEESNSCAFVGLDKVYTYPGFTIQTRPDGEKDYVYIISFTDDSVNTNEGIYIGQSVEDVRAAYKDYTPLPLSSNILAYSDKNTTIRFTIRDNAVTSIQYTLIENN